MLYYDGCFAKYKIFRYFCTNTLMRSKALMKGRLFVRKNSFIASMKSDQIRFVNDWFYKNITSVIFNSCDEIIRTKALII